MIKTQRLSSPLTALDTALAMVLDGLDAVASRDVALSDALGAVAADMPCGQAFPPCDLAAVDGWALRAGDLVGASCYAPLMLARQPIWVEAGDAMPDCCDCVVDLDVVECSGPTFQVLEEAAPGQGVRRSGSDVAEGGLVVAAGWPIRPLGLLAARIADRMTLTVRQPRVRIVNCPATDGSDTTTRLIVGMGQAAGAAVTRVDAAARHAAAIADALDVATCDLLVVIGGSGVGRSDATATALSQCGQLLAHGLAMQPGRTAAVARIRNIPVVALPGSVDHALAAWWTLLLPVLDRLSARRPRRAIVLPLARKIASRVGIAEIALLRMSGHQWSPLACGDLSLDHIAQADAWCAIPAGSEGFAAGASLEAYPLRDHT